MVEISCPASFCHVSPVLVSHVFPLTFFMFICPFLDYIAVGCCLSHGQIVEVLLERGRLASCCFFTRPLCDAPVPFAPNASVPYPVPTCPRTGLDTALVLFCKGSKNLSPWYPFTARRWRPLALFCRVSVSVSPHFPPPGIRPSDKNPAD